MQNKWRILYYALIAVIGVGLISWLVSVANQCAAPAEPNYTTNQIIEHYCKGRIVFISPMQNYLPYGLFAGVMIVGVVAGWVKKKSSSKLTH